MKAKLILSRISKPPREYFEDVLEDNTTCLRTLTHVPEEFRVTWSQKWQADGLIKHRKILTAKITCDKLELSHT
jgi:hypothetical protein